MLKKIKSSVLVFLATLPLTALSAVDPLEVVLKQPASREKAEMAFVTVNVTNRSGRPLLLPKVDSPLDSDNGHLWNNIVKVVSAPGETVAYTGRATRVATREKDVRFWTINPGQTMSADVDLAMNYDIKGGAYKLSYSQPYIEVSDWNPDEVSYTMVPSNELQIYANSSLLSRERALRTSYKITAPSSLGTLATGPDTTCTSEQATPINAARNTASSWAFYGKSAANSLFNVRHSVVDGKISWKPSIASDAMYTTWFGAPLNDSPGFPSVPQLQQVWDSGDFFPLHVTSAINNRVNLDDRYSCGCSDAAEAKGAAAWTEESVTHMCSLFFRLPFSTYGVDSQVIIILHENAHHSDSNGPYIGDQPQGYGRIKAKALAATDRTMAIINADNYAYYAEAVRMSKDKTAAAPLLENTITER
ncbi:MULTISPECIES: M35 family metallo-endopeptidase [unclassified Luteibacter]|uniref:M35 family metallo-endopeptidase n=1 Tax=Luteibacter sp. PvP019 TaxID=3156436 RepID=UPI003397F3A7